MPTSAQLDVNGEVEAGPKESDISAAIERIAQSAQGYVMLTRTGGFYLEAAPSGEGMFGLACGDEQKKQRQFATAPVTGSEAKALLGDFLAGGDAWRRQCKWRGRDTSVSRDTPSGGLSGPFRRALPNWLAGAAAFAFMAMTWVLPVLLPAALVLVLCAFVVWKAWREAQVRRWPHIDGRVTASGLQPRRRRFRMEATRLDNIPSMAYEFSVGGKRYVGARLGLNTEYAGVDVGALVARYPVGATVPVYYNPSDPNDCLLDPFANRGLAGDAFELFAILGAFAAALYYGASALTHIVREHFPFSSAPRVVFASLVGVLFLLLFAWSFRARPRTVVPLRAAGKITKSEVEEVWHEGTGGTFRSLQPTIEIGYSVEGQNYILRTRVGESIAAQSQDEAQEQLAPYPVGRAVNVLYKRDNPGASSLEGNISDVDDGPSQTAYRLTALALAFACFLAAAISLGVL